jgi:hypothetical protein
MFQYAYGRSEALTKNTPLILDISSFTHRAANETPRTFDLNCFNIKPEKIVDEATKDSFLKKIIRKIFLPASYGFWQSEKYFKKHSDIIRADFTLRNPISDDAKVWEEKIKKAPTSIALHARRGDYVNDKKTNQYHGVCDEKYYQSAYNEIIKRIPQNELAGHEVFIFSDDIAWVKENVSLPCPIHFVSETKMPNYEEMYLMSACNHNIISNSSFSWWGAWLNQNKNKIVIAPKQWFAPSAKVSDQISKSIVPEEWIRV